MMVSSLRTLARRAGAALLASALAAAQPAGTPLPAAVAQSTSSARTYTLGERTLEQTWLPRRDPARTMPYRAEGIIAVPEGDGPFPLVLIFHDAHPSCPPDTSIPDLTLTTWPCSPGKEQRNDIGLAYLADALAARGYIAVIPNLNVIYAAAYESVGPELRRYPELLSAHLAGLVQANRNATPAFGASLRGKIDFTRIGIIGHGHGALLAMQSARLRQGRSRSRTTSPADGPLSAVLLVAPVYAPEGDADVPLGVVLPSCDGVDPELSGQGYYEDARLARSRRHFAASVYLIGANHNAFNPAVQEDDAQRLPAQSACRDGTRIPASRQRDFLARYAADFLDVAMQVRPAEVRPAEVRPASAAAAAGLDAAGSAPTDLYGLPVRTALSPATAQRAIIIRPSSEEELGYNGFGSYAIRSGASHIAFCPYRQPCGRWAIQPGNPAQFRFSWNDPRDARWTLPLGDTPADLSSFATLHLRVTLDPTDYLNAHRERQILSLTLSDEGGRSATVQLSEAEAPALSYPPGQPNREAWGWIGHAYLSSIRVPLSAFTGVDPTRVTSLDLRPGGARSGSLFIADIEFLRSTTP